MFESHSKKGGKERAADGNGSADGSQLYTNVLFFNFFAIKMGTHMNINK